MVLDLLRELVDRGLKLPLEVLGGGHAVEEVAEGGEETLDTQTQILGGVVSPGAEATELLILGVEEDGEEGEKGGEVLHKHLIPLHIGILVN